VCLGVNVLRLGVNVLRLALRGFSDAFSVFVFTVII
jgi:hypothetical protein